jgi:hypothetical protein
LNLNGVHSSNSVDITGKLQVNFSLQAREEWMYVFFSNMNTHLLYVKKNDSKIFFVLIHHEGNDILENRVGKTH